MAKSQHINEAEFQRALRAAENTRYPVRDRCCLLLSGRAGMRLGEIRGLNLGDVVEPSTGEIRDRIHLSAKRTKHGVARDVFLNDEVRQGIGAVLADIRGDQLGPLIRTQSGNRFSLPALSSLFKKLYRRARLPAAGSHSGRALFIQSLDDRRTPLRVIMKAVGHRHLASTEAYLSARPAEVKAAVQQLVEQRRG